MVNKKKFGEIPLMQFVMNLIIAIIVLGIIFFLFSKAYSGYSEKNAIEKAEESLNLILGKIARIERGLDEDFVTIIPPKEWYLRSFIQSAPPGSKCLTDKKSCICICKDLRCFEPQKSCVNSDSFVEVSPFSFDDEKQSITLKLKKDLDKVRIEIAK